MYLYSVWSTNKLVHTTLAEQPKVLVPTSRCCTYWKSTEYCWVGRGLKGRKAGGTSLSPNMIRRMENTKKKSTADEGRHVQLASELRGV